MDSEVTNLEQVKAFDSSDYATAAQGTTADNALPKAGGTMTGAITLSGAPTADNHAVTKTYVDEFIAAGIHYHNPVRVESPDSAGNLTATYDNGTNGVGATLTNSGTQEALVFDGITLSTNDRVLIYNQTNAFENGIYTVTNVGSDSTNWVLTRATDADSYGLGNTELSEGTSVFVTEGTDGSGEIYACTTTGAITFGTTDINFSQIGKSAVLIGGTGITVSGNTINVTNDSIGATQLNVADNGTSGQVLKSDGDGSFSWADDNDTTYSNATTSDAGLMSSNDKTKLDGIAASAEVNQNAFSSVAVSGQTTVAADSKTDTLTFVAGSNVSITTDATADSITIASTDTNTNTTYSISAETVTDGANLRLTDSDASTDDVSIIGGTNVTVTRTDADTITISSTDTNTDTTYSAGTGLTLDGTEFNANVNATAQTTEANTVSSTASRTYAVQVDGSDNLVVNVPWSDTNTVYTLPEATSTARGGIELFSDTDQTVAANDVTATAGRTYGVQLNSDGQAVVNVPWVDTNTVYTHPTHDGDDIDLDTGALTGATVISDLDFNVTTDTLGHVTDANATYSTRNLTASDVGAVAVSGDSMTGNLSFGDGNKATFGAGDDLQILHYNNQNFINSANNMGLYFNNDLVSFNSEDGTYETLALDNANNKIVAYTNMEFGDNNKAIFGAGSDLQIYHNGSSSRIEDSGTGNLEIRGDNVLIRSYTGGEAFIRGFTNAQVDLFYNAAVKLATTNTGIDVTGTITSDGLTVEGISKSVANEVTANSATTTIDMTASNFHVVSMSTNTTFSLSNLSSAITSSGTIIIKQDGTGGRNFTLPSSCKTPVGGASIVQSTGANTTSILTYLVVSSTEVLVNYIGNYA